ncbi:MAG: methionyl-tRNA formyltransferase [Propionicimonas sp.]|nr:methionyl-tRNA formyltransferase [Propionicimonas sp.]
MRLLFAGTPVVAAHTLSYLLEHTGHEVVAVLTRPDAPQGRSKRPVPSPVARLALDHGIEVHRPERAGDPQFLRRLRELAPEACPVIAYGALLPQPVLDVPAHGWLNVHYSLLPRWRGAAPVQRAILAGDGRTGVTVFRLVAAMDAGPVFADRAVEIGPAETSGMLLERLTPLGAGLLAETLDRLAAGTAVATEQPGDGVTVAPKLTVAEARLDWGRPAAELARLVRACNPSPMAWTTYAGERFRVLLAEAGDGGLPAGVILPGRREVLVGTAEGVLRLLEVQPQGRRPMPAAAWANGLRGDLGSFA